MWMHETFILLHQPSSATMQPVSAGDILSWWSNVSRYQTHFSGYVSLCGPVMLSVCAPPPALGFFPPNWDQGLQSNPNTSLSPSFSLKCTLKAPFSSSPPRLKFWVVCLLPFFTSCQPYFLCAHIYTHTLPHPSLWRACSLPGGSAAEGHTDSTMGLQEQFHARFSWTFTPSQRSTYENSPHKWESASLPAENWQSVNYLHVSNLN